MTLIVYTYVCYRENRKNIDVDLKNDFDDLMKVMRE